MFVLNLQWLFKDIQTKCSFIASGGVSFGMNSQVYFVLKRRDYAGIFDTTLPHHDAEFLTKKEQTSVAVVFQCVSIVSIN